MKTLETLLLEKSVKVSYCKNDSHISFYVCEDSRHTHHTHALQRKRNGMKKRPHKRIPPVWLYVWTRRFRSAKLIQTVVPCRFKFLVHHFCSWVANLNLVVVYLWWFPNKARSHSFEVCMCISVNVCLCVNNCFKSLPRTKYYVENVAFVNRYSEKQFLVKCMRVVWEHVWRAVCERQRWTGTENSPGTMQA